MTKGPSSSILYMISWLKTLVSKQTAQTRATHDLIKEVHPRPPSFCPRPPRRTHAMLGDTKHFREDNFQQTYEMEFETTLPLANFEIFNKPNYAQEQYPDYNCYEDEKNHQATYVELHNPRDYTQLNYTSKRIEDWTPEESLAWVVDVARSRGIPEVSIPIFNFHIPGEILKLMKIEDLIRWLSNYGTPPDSIHYYAKELHDQLRMVVEGSNIPVSVLGYQNMDCYDDRMNWAPQEDEFEEKYRIVDNSSPVGSNGSRGTSDDEDKSKVMKRPPGRPRGTGKKNNDPKVKTQSVPEFLKDLLLDPATCPSIIKWEIYEEGKFRFVKPEEVARIWGSKKNNPKMSYEKFSRAMRYHYKQHVLEPVTSARLVYKFGVKGPKYQTSDPNFTKTRTLDCRNA